MTGMRDEFLSEDDLDLKSLTLEELDRVWTAWLLQAQVTNDRDAGEYSHGVFAGMDLTSLFPKPEGQFPPSGGRPGDGDDG